MDLIEIYIQEVTRKLPEKNRADIALELKSIIQDMLPDEYGENEVKNVLEKLGNPAILANQYKDRPMYLIGPAFYTVYMSLLKMIIPIAATVFFIFLLGEFIIDYTDDVAIINVLLRFIGEAVSGIVWVGVQTFFWLTLTFAVIERVGIRAEQLPFSTSGAQWKADDLKNITPVPTKKSISKWEVFFSLFWTSIWASVYFNADNLIGIYETGSEGLVFVAPVFNQDILLNYMPFIIIVIALEIGLAIYKLIQPQWTKSMAIYNVISQILFTVIFIVILMNPNLITPDIINYMTGIFNVTIEKFNWLLFVTVSIALILATVFNIVDGLRKANMIEIINTKRQ